MGIEIHITVPHNLSDLSLGRIEATFRPLDSTFGEIAKFYDDARGTVIPVGGWSVCDRECLPDSYPYLPVAFTAPAGFSFDFGPHAICIHHHTRLGVFCTETVIRDLLRKFTRHVLDLMSGDRAVYSPDDYLIYDMVMEGLAFTEIESRLLQSGVPASSFTEFDVRETRPDHYYYIDRFEDFCETRTA